MDPQGAAAEAVLVHARRSVRQLRGGLLASCPTGAAEQVAAPGPRGPGKGRWRCGDRMQPFRRGASMDTGVPRAGVLRGMSCCSCALDALPAGPVHAWVDTREGNDRLAVTGQLQYGTRRRASESQVPLKRVAWWRDRLQGALCYAAAEPSWQLLCQAVAHVSCDVGKHPLEAPGGTKARITHAHRWPTRLEPACYFAFVTTQLHRYAHRWPGPRLKSHTRMSPPE